MGGNYGFPSSTTMVTDSIGNILTAGYFQGNVDFDPGPAFYYLSSENTTKTFVTKTDASGNLIWAKAYGGRNINSIAVYGLNSICITGTFENTADLDPGAGIYNLTSEGGTDIFIARLNGSGDLVWARQIGSYWDDSGLSLAIDASENIITTGDFVGNVDFDPGPGNFNLNTGVFTHNVFISKLNSNGNFVFAKHLPGDDSYVKEMTLDNSGSIIITGYFQNMTDFDPDISVYNLTSSGFNDIFIAKYNTNGFLVWAKKIGGSNLDISYSVKSDAAGNIYTIGIFEDTVDFDPGVSVDNIISAGNSDIFITKLDVSGNYVWTYKIGGVSSDEGRSIYLDGFGNIYATGRFGGSIDFDAGIGIFNLTAANYDVFILKLDTSGSFVFAKSMEGGASSFATGGSIAVDQSGNIYASGGFTKTYDFDPGPGVFNLNALYTSFVFNLKLDISGNFLWAYSIGESSAASLISMTADPAGNVYATGYFYGNVDFDSGPGVFNLSTDPSDTYGDVFVAKYNSTGNLLWAKKMGGTGYDVATSIAVDATGNVYTVGSYQGTADFNPGSATYNLVASTPGREIFVSKLNAFGKFVWARNVGGASSSETPLSLALDPTGKLIIAGNGYLPSVGDHIFLKKISSAGILEWYNIYEESLFNRVNALTTDDNGNVCFTGFFRDTLDFDPGTGIYNLVAISSSYDAFVSKLDGAGNFIWAKQFSGLGLDHASVIKTDAAGNIHVGGYFEQTTDFDPGTGIYNLSVTGTRDIFILKLESDGDFILAKQIGGFLDAYIRSIAVDLPGNIYILGVFNSANVDFDPGLGIFNLSPTGLNDGFVSKLDASGNFVWAQVIGSENEAVYAITLDASTNIYIGGTFIGTGDFDPGSGVANLTATGYPDMFIQKIGQCVLPTAIITPVGSTTFCVGQSVLLNANLVTGLTYQWKRNGVSISGATSSSYIATTSGKYTVHVSDLSPCTSVSNSISVTVPCIPIGPNQNRPNLPSDSDEEVINLYPNPTTGIFVINSPEGQLEIINSYGQLMRIYLLTRNENTFDLSDLPNGIYILKLNTGKSSFTEKIILNH